MKYAALLTSNADDIVAWEKLTPEEAASARAEEIPKWEALFNELGPTGVFGFSAELDAPRTSKTVRADGETIVTDGPFAETKEQIGGLIGGSTADDLDAAIAPSPHASRRLPRAGRGAEAGHRALTVERASGRTGDVRRDSHPRPRRHAACRGRGARRLRDRARALATRWHSRQPHRLDRHHRAQPSDRSDPA